MRRKKIGTMDFHGIVDITDPCYNRDVWCRMTDVKIRNGVYTCIASACLEIAPERAYMSTRMNRWHTSFQRCNLNWTKPKDGSESHRSENIVFH